MHALAIRNLSFTYRGAATPAIQDIELVVARGEVLGILGPSGAGKSTLQKILTRLLHGYTGSAMVLGNDLAAWGSNYYERIGVAFELPNHFRKLTAIENLRYFAALYQQSAMTPDEALARVGLADDGTTPVAQFSKGMQMRLGLARAMLHGPELLFLDEPTSGLDPANARQVIALIRDLRDHGATVLLTTHNMGLAEGLCDRVAFLVDGRMPLVDTPRALRLRYGRQVVRVEQEDGMAAEFALAGLADNQAFLAALRNGVQTIHTQEATLDEIFVHVTGRHLSVA